MDSQSSVTCVDSVSRRIFLRSYFYRGCFSAEEEVGDIKAVPLIGRGRRVPSRADSQSASRRQNYVYEVIFMSVRTAIESVVFEVVWADLVSFFRMSKWFGQMIPAPNGSLLSEYPRQL